MDLSKARSKVWKKGFRAFHDDLVRALSGSAAAVDAGNVLYRKKVISESELIDVRSERMPYEASSKLLTAVQKTHSEDWFDTLVEVVENYHPELAAKIEDACAEALDDVEERDGGGAGRVQFTQQQQQQQQQQVVVSTAQPVPSYPASVDSSLPPPVLAGGVAATSDQLQSHLQVITVQLQQTMNQVMMVTQNQQAVLQMQSQGQSSPELQVQSMQLMQQAQALSQTQQSLMAEQQRLSTALQQARLQESMLLLNLQQQQQQQQQQQPPPQPQPHPQHSQPQPLSLQSAVQPPKAAKLALRLRDTAGSLKDIKFGFDPSQDTADAIANDLLSAGLLDARNIIAVASNITKILENPSLDKVTFPLTLPNLAPETVDEKKLIGFAQISRNFKQ